MKKILYEGNQIHNFISSSGSGTVINYGSSSDFLTSYGSGSGSTTLLGWFVGLVVLVQYRRCLSCYSQPSTKYFFLTAHFFILLVPIAQQLGQWAGSHARFPVSNRYCTQCCGSGSGIRCLFDPWVRDFFFHPSLLLLFLDPGSGMEKKPDPG